MLYTTSIFPKRFFIWNCILNSAFNELYSLICLVRELRLCLFPKSIKAPSTQLKITSRISPWYSPTPAICPNKLLTAHSNYTRKYSQGVYVCVYLCRTYGIFKIFFVRNFFFFLTFGFVFSSHWLCVSVSVSTLE